MFFKYFYKAASLRSHRFLHTLAGRKFSWNKQIKFFFTCIWHLKFDWSSAFHTRIFIFQPVTKNDWNDSVIFTRIVKNFSLNVNESPSTVWRKPHKFLECIFNFFFLVNSSVGIIAFNEIIPTAAYYSYWARSKLIIFTNVHNIVIWKSTI